MKRLVYLLPVVLLMLLVGVFWWGLGNDPSEVPSPLIDKPAPAFALPPLKDDKPGLALDDLKGKVTLVNFFASWCIPCRAEHPLLMDLARQGKLTIVGVAYKDKKEDATAWLARLGDPYSRIAMDLDGRAAIDWGVYGVPETYVTDRDGRIRFKHVGPLTRRDLDETVLPLVERLSQ